MYGDFPAKNIVNTRYIPKNAWFWPTLFITNMQTGINATSPVLKRTHALTLTTNTTHTGGEKLKKAKASVAKLEREMADGETDAAKKAVQVRWNWGMGVHAA
jgi:hypothetical protein